MTVEALRKSVLVVCDDHRLYRAIEVNLKERQILEILDECLCCQGESVDQPVNNFDLIVLVLSSPTSEPLISLARASLVKRIGQIPIMIVSSRTFDSAPDLDIYHMNFPFDVSSLQDKINEILQIS